MSRTGVANALVIALPVGAVAMIALALLWTIDGIPRVPIISEVVGLLAVLLAPGVVVEPAFHGGRWTLMERLGLAAALSIALTGLLGFSLHLAGLPVSPTNVLGLILLVATPVGALSFRFRICRRARPTPRSLPLEVVVGLGSLALLTAGFISILILRPAPEAPGLEVMAIDRAGRLIAMPIRSDVGGTALTVAIRSASGATSSASLSVDGDGVRSWSAFDLAIGTDWTTMQVPLETTRTGTLHALVSVRGGGTELTLPISINVAP